MTDYRTICQRARTRSAALILSAAAVVAVSSGARAATYGYTDLGTSGGTLSSALGINNAGDVVGGNTDSSGRTFATLWRSGATIDLGQGAGRFSVAYDINNHGDIVGVSSEGGSERRATLWSGGGASVLGGRTGSVTGAYGISDSGMTVGSSGDFYGVATLWAGGTTTILNGLPGQFGAAVAINQAGVIVGSGETLPGYQHAAKWVDGKVSDLGTLGDYYLASGANDINDSGQIVGWSWPTSEGTATRAVLWDGSVMIDLGTLGGTFSSALGINNKRQIVGSSRLVGDNVTHAALWDGVAWQDLNVFLDAASKSAGWYLMDARNINDNGWIIGNAKNSLTGEQHAYLLSVVPEPASFLLALASLCVLGVAAPRRKTKLEQ